MDYDDLLGRVVYSTAGRDKDRYFIVIGIFNDEYVYISDGDLRTLEKPKKKKVKHISVTNTIAEEIKKSLLASEKLENIEIKRFLQSKGINKEV